MNITTELLEEFMAWARDENKTRRRDAEKMRKADPDYTYRTLYLEFNLEEFLEWLKMRAE